VVLATIGVDLLPQQQLTAIAKNIPLMFDYIDKTLQQQQQNF